MNGETIAVALAGGIAFGAGGLYIWLLHRKLNSLRGFIDGYMEDKFP